MNPFQQLIDTATATRTICRGIALREGESKTEFLLRMLRDVGPQTTVDLSAALGDPTRLVWGLLKVPRETGRVYFDAGVWRINHRFVRPDIARAAELLRSQGWTVTEPGPLQ